MLKFAEFFENFNLSTTQCDKNVSFHGPQPTGFYGGAGAVSQLNLKVPKKKPLRRKHKLAKTRKH